MANGQMPGPLAALGDRVEVQVREAPGGKDTELAARLRQPEPGGPGPLVARLSGDDPCQQVRTALREAKQLIEVGEVLKIDPTPHGRRAATPTGKLVEVATRRAGGEGVLRFPRLLGDRRSWPKGRVRSLRGSTEEVPRRAA